MSTDDPHTTNPDELECPRPDEESPASTDRRPVKGPTFTPLIDVSAVIILVAWIAMMLSAVYGTPAVERIPHPERALALVVGVSMDLETALDDIPAWERGLYVYMVLGDESGLQEGLDWYRELYAHTGDPAVGLHLAILEGEAGRLERLRQLIQSWKDEDEGGPLRRRLVEAAYLGTRLDPLAESRLQAELAELLPAGWFYDRLALRLAERAGNEPRQEARRRAAMERRAALLARTRAFLAVEAAVVASGLLIAALWFLPRRRDPAATRVGPASVPPPWSGWAGVLVLIRGAAAGVLVTIAFILAGAGPLAARLLMVPLINAPLLLLAARDLLHPHGLGYRDGLGLKPVPGGVTTLVLAVPVLSAAGILLDWGVVLLVQPFDLTMHWTDWFDADLVWAEGIPLAAALLEYLVFAPVLEEIVFRGILFGTLRRRFSFPVAAILSALLFAVAHGYGLLGLVSVCASGLLWAWAYERTGSLLPGMIAHFLNNLLVCAGVMAMLR